MINCVACQTPLAAGLDTYGPHDQPLCMACYFDVNAYIEKMNGFDSSHPDDPDPDDDFDDNDAGRGRRAVGKTLGDRLLDRTRRFSSLPPRSMWHQNSGVQPWLAIPSVSSAAVAPAWSRPTAWISSASPAVPSGAPRFGSAHAGAVGTPSLSSSAMCSTRTARCNHD